MRKDGFSIAEFMISITIMFVIAATVLPTLLMKKDKEPVEWGKEEGKYVCSCAEGDGAEGAECKFTFTKDMGEFLGSFNWCICIMVDSEIARLRVVSIPVYTSTKGCCCSISFCCTALL